MKVLPVMPLCVLAVVVLTPSALASPSSEQQRASVLRRAKHYEQTAGYHTLAFRELVTIIERATGNYSGLRRCVDAVYHYGSNTPTIVALAGYIAAQSEPVPHLDYLLKVAAEHGSESESVRKHLRQYVLGEIAYERLLELVEPTM